MALVGVELETLVSESDAPHIGSMFWFKLKLILNGVQLKNQIKKQADMVLPVSPKVDLGNCPICLTSDVFPRVRRINRTNKQ